MNFKIEPIKGFNRIADNIDINIIDYQFGKNLTIYYSINDTSVIYSGNLNYTEEVIKGWVEDDYIINIICQELKITLINNKIDIS